LHRDQSRHRQEKRLAPWCLAKDRAIAHEWTEDSANCECHNGAKSRLDGFGPWKKKVTMRPWHLGNTTVRNPFRLRDGLIALAKSELKGNIKGRESENAFARLLQQNDIVNITRKDVDASDLGRKWRSALSQLGFIVPELDVRLGLEQKWVGEPFTITNNGRRLIEATTVPGMQECFLRSLAAYYIPSALEKGYKVKKFSPLRHTLATMLELERRTGDDRLNFLEMALIVQLTSSSDTVAAIADRVIAFRQARARSGRQFDHEALDSAAREHGYKVRTFLDYADTNFRYLKATGLVQSRGHGLALVPEKHLFIEQLVADKRVPDSDQSYLIGLCNGATLPIDNPDTAQLVLEDLVRQANSRGIPFDLRVRDLTDAADIAIVRHKIEQSLSERNEEEYAKRQADAWEEIAAYMELIIKRQPSMRLPNGVDIEVPQAEAPAYFEWILWRAFLAINNLTNQPYEARRFKIDQDFLPVGCAPGNGPDLIFEFEDFVIVVEVTLTENSRQEAVEGEPVRRHVAELVESYAARPHKQVYGLFIANRIDVNTAETFRSGVWYRSDDTRMRLDIVPITLQQFKNFFEGLFRSRQIDARLVRGLLDHCGKLRSVADGAPMWKQEIATAIEQYVGKLYQ